MMMVKMFSYGVLGKTPPSCLFWFLFSKNYKNSGCSHEFLVKIQNSVIFDFFSKYAIIMAFFMSFFDKKAHFSHSLFGQNMLKSQFFDFSTLLSWFFAKNWKNVTLLSFRPHISNPMAVLFGIFSRPKQLRSNALVFVKICWK